MKRYKIHSYKRGKNGSYDMCTRCGTKRRGRNRRVDRGRVRIAGWEWKEPEMAWTRTNPPCAAKGAK